MELNINKIHRELKRLGKNQSWLANEAKMSRQLLSYLLKKKSVGGAEKIGKALDIDPRDLIK